MNREGDIPESNSRTVAEERVSRDRTDLYGYLFSVIHVGVFGASGFFMAYESTNPQLLFLFVHGGLAILIYLLFYLAAFGQDSIKWMWINAILGLYGITGQIDWILSLFGREVQDYPWYVHIIPFSYYVMYTFLLRQAVLDVFRARRRPQRRRVLGVLYVLGSLAIYSHFHGIY